MPSFYVENEHSYTENSESTFSFEDLPPESFHTSNTPDGSSVRPPLTMPYRTKSGNLFDTSKSSPTKSRHGRKLAMVVKKPKSGDTDLNNSDHMNSPKPAAPSSSNSLETELTDFLAAANATKGLPLCDDGTTSTTSRTTKSSVGSSKENKAQHERSLGSRITEEDNNHSTRERVTNHNDWDWSQHTSDWMGFEKNNNGSNNNNCIDESITTGEVFPELAASSGDHMGEAIQRLNDSSEFEYHHHKNNDGEGSQTSSQLRRGSGSRRGYRRIARHQEMAMPGPPMARRLGERSRSSGYASRSSDDDESYNNSHSGRSSSRRGSHRSTASARSKSRTRTRSKSRDSSRRKSSHARLQNVRSKSRDRSRRSSSPTSSTRRRRMSGAKGPQTQRRSRSIDHSSQHSAASEGTTPYSNQSRRGRRRGSMNGSSTSNNNGSHTFNNSSTNFDADCWVDSIPSCNYEYQDTKEPIRSPEPEPQRSSHQRRPPGRQARRSSMTNATLTSDNVRARSKSVSRRAARRRSTGDDTDSDYLNGSSHHGSNSQYDYGPPPPKSSHSRRGSNDSQRGSSRRGSGRSTSSKHASGSRNRSRSRGARSSHHRARSKSTDRGSYRSQSTDRGSHSPRSDDSNNVLDSSMRKKRIVPERLNRVLDRSSNHKKNSQESQLEKVALAIFVAEDDDAIDPNLHEAVENVPDHMLNPSNVPLSLHW